MKSKFLVFILTVVMVIQLTVISYGAEVPTIVINGNHMKYNDEMGRPYINAENRTMVPLKMTMEEYGCTVTWDAPRNTAVVKRDGTIIEIPIGKKYILVNGTRIENDTAAITKNGRTYLPINVVLSNMGAEVKWDSVHNKVYANEIETVRIGNQLFYKDFPAVPALEGASNINMFFWSKLSGKSVSNDYLYNIATKKDAAAATTDYITTLKNMGYTNNLEMNDSEAMVSMWTSNNQQYEVFITTLLKTDDSSISICVTPLSSSKGVPYYANYPGVPDFGKLYNVTCDVKTDSSYAYKTNATGIETNLKAYLTALVDAGFMHVSDITTSIGVEAPIFVNQHIGKQVCVSLEMIAGNYMIIVMIDDYPAK